MTCIKLIQHAQGAPGLRLLGLGPSFRPCRGLFQLKNLLDNNAFWAAGRSTKQLSQLLAKSSVVITLWRDKQIVGFGRATSDGIFRAVLWDIVVANDLQGLGLGRQVVDALLSAPALQNVEKIYLMTTNSKEFYLQLGFEETETQSLLFIAGKNKPHPQEH